MSRLLTPGLYGYDDLRRGDRVETGAVTVTTEIIDQFAALTGDRFAIHMSDAGAQAYGFPARVAHGLLVLSLIDGLKNQAPAQFDAVASLGWEWSFRKPVLAGDVLSARLTLTSKRPTRTAGRGILRLAVTVLRGEDVVQEGRNLLLVKRA